MRHEEGSVVVVGVVVVAVTVHLARRLPRKGGEVQTAESGCLRKRRYAAMGAAVRTNELAVARSYLSESLALRCRK